MIADLFLAAKDLAIIVDEKLDLKAFIDWSFDEKPNPKIPKFKAKTIE